MRPAMPLKIKSHTTLLTEVDRLYVRQITEGKYVREFSVHYEAFIDHRWQKVTRFDNSHDSLPHRHIFHPNGLSRKYLMNTPDINLAFTDAQKFIKQNFLNLRQAYIILVERGKHKR